MILQATLNKDIPIIGHGWGTILPDCQFYTLCKVKEAFCSVVKC